MSKPFIGDYNIQAEGGGSVAVAPDDLQIVDINRTDIKQHWTILPLGGVTVGDSGLTVTIQSAYTGAFVVPGNDGILRYSLNPYAWSISKGTGLYYFIQSTPPGGSTLNWNRSGQRLTYGSAQARWIVVPSPSEALRKTLT